MTINLLRSLLAANLAVIVRRARPLGSGAFSNGNFFTSHATFMAGHWCVTAFHRGTINTMIGRSGNNCMVLFYLEIDLFSNCALYRIYVLCYGCMHGSRPIYMQGMSKIMPHVHMVQNVLYQGDDQTYAKSTSRL
jgi:hypothetical protein